MLCVSFPVRARHENDNDYARAERTGDALKANDRRYEIRVELESGNRKYWKGLRSEYVGRLSESSQN